MNLKFSYHLKQFDDVGNYPTSSEIAWMINLKYLETFGDIKRFKLV